jgi:Domain of unknown function (DUF4158)
MPVEILTRRPAHGVGALPRGDRRGLADGVLLVRRRRARADHSVPRYPWALRYRRRRRRAALARVRAGRTRGTVRAGRLPDRQPAGHRAVIYSARAPECRARRSREHIARAVAISTFGPCQHTELEGLRAWLADSALGHDGPLALLRSAVDRLCRDRPVRPGLTVRERLVTAARSDAEQEIHRRSPRS